MTPRCWLLMTGGGRVRVLVATDGSPGAAVAQDTLCSLALRPGDEVIVVSYPSYFLNARPGERGPVSALMERELAAAQERVQTSVAALAARVSADVRGFVPNGLEPVDAILTAALDCAVDLLVVGSRGRGPVSSMFLGSTSRTLAMLSPVPILIVRAHSTLQRILVAYDASPAARAAIDLVRRLPLGPAARLTLAAVLSTREWPDASHTSDELRYLRESVERDERIRVAEQLATAATLLALPHDTRIESGPVPEALLERAEAMRADLIVVGSRGMTGPRRLFWGNTAERLAMSARCPVLIVPAPASVDRATAAADLLVRSAS